MKKSEVILKIKRNKMVRTLAFPVVNTIRAFRLFTFQFTKDSEQMKKYKGTHQGERCFIIGNGPSLSVEDLERLKDEYCFAANCIYKIFDETNWRPQSYLCVDSFVFGDNKTAIGRLTVPNIFVHLEGKKYNLNNPRIIYINNYYPYLINQYKRVKHIGFSTDVSHHFVEGETVTYNAIQLAVYMGFQEIYLLGVDHSYSKTMDANGNLLIDPGVKDYFGNLKSSSYTIQNVNTSTSAYRAARAYCEKNGLVIRNITRGGKLEVFERSTLDEVLNHKRERR